MSYHKDYDEKNIYIALWKASLPISYHEDDDANNDYAILSQALTTKCHLTKMIISITLISYFINNDDSNDCISLEKALVT